MFGSALRKVGGLGLFYYLLDFLQEETSEERGHSELLKNCT